MVVRERGAVIEDRHGEVKLRGQWRHGLRDVARSGNPQRAGGRNGFPIEPLTIVLVSPGDREILFDSPTA